jgi:hypothetical protein
VDVELQLLGRAEGWTFPGRAARDAGVLTDEEFGREENRLLAS